MCVSLWTTVVHNTAQNSSDKSQIPLRQLVRSWLLTSFEPVCDQLRTSFEPDSVMEFGFKFPSYLPDNRHSSDDVYTGGEGTSRGWSYLALEEFQFSAREHFISHNVLMTVSAHVTIAVILRRCRFIARISVVELAASVTRRTRPGIAVELIKCRSEYRFTNVTWSRGDLYQAAVRPSTCNMYEVSTLTGSRNEVFRNFCNGC